MSNLSETPYIVSYIKSLMIKKIKEAKENNTSKSDWDTYNFLINLAQSLDLNGSLLGDESRIDDTIKELESCREKNFTNKRNHNKAEYIKINILVDNMENYYSDSSIKKRLNFFNTTYQSLQEQISNTYNTIKASIQSTIIKYKRYLDCVQFDAYQKGSDAKDIDFDEAINEIKKLLYEALSNDFDSLRALLVKKVYDPLCNNNGIYFDLLIDAECINSSLDQLKLKYQNFLSHITDKAEQGMENLGFEPKDISNFFQYVDDFSELMRQATEEKLGKGVPNE